MKHKHGYHFNASHHGHYHHVPLSHHAMQLRSFRNATQSRVSAGFGGGGKRKSNVGHKHTLTHKIPQATKRPLSFTKTKTKEKMSDFTQARNGVENTRIHVATGLKRSKGIEKTGILYHDMYSGSQFVGANQECYALISAVGTVSQWLTTDLTTNVNRASLSYGSFYNLNVEEGIYNGATALATNREVPSQDCMSTLGGVMHVDLVNRLAAPAHVQLEFYVATKDTNGSPLLWYNQALGNNNAYKVNATFGSYPALGVAGNAIQSFTPSTVTDYEQLYTPVYSNISQKRLPRTEWKKVKVWADVIGGNSAHSVTCSLSLNQKNLRERMVFLNGQNCYYPKGALVCLLKIRGAAGIMTVAETEQASITTADIGFVVNRKLRLGTVKVKADRYEAEYDGFGVPMGGTTANFSTLDVAPLLQQVLATN